MTITAPLSAPTFERPISATERLYLSGQELSSPFAIQLLVEGIGEIDRAALLGAVDRASQACPGARLVQRGDNWMDSGVTPHIEFVSGSVDFTRLDEEALLQRPLGSTPGATTDVTVVADATTTIIFRAFHGVMDAKGLQTWASDVFRVLRGEEPLGAPETTADFDLVERIGKSGKPTRVTPTFRSPIGSGAPVSGEPTFRWKHRTVHGAATAAVARISAVLADAADGPVRVMVPVDLRRHDPAIRSTANLALPLFLDPKPGQSWSEINAQMLVGMVERRELNEMDNGGLAKFPGPVARTILRGAHALGARTGRNVFSAIVSHAGRIDPASAGFPGFEVIAVRALGVHTGLVPMTIVIVECGDTTEITVSYRTGRGLDERVERLLDSIEAALSTAPIDAPIDAPYETCSDETANSMFRRCVEQTPNAVAVTSPDGELSYLELDRRANAVASVLRGRGIGTGSVVAILAGRTVTGVVAQLAVMRAGAAFLALDPKHPSDRLGATIADSGAPLALVEGAYADKLNGVEQLTLEDLPVSVEETIDVPVTGHDVAYVTYTSGSTGRPKGVMVPHGGVANFIEASIDWYRLGPETRFAHYHTPAADLACGAFFSPLMTGGSITLVPEGISHVSMKKMLCESGANTFMFTPSLLEVVVRLDIEVPTPRTVILIGEQFTPSLAARSREFFGSGALIHNSYGPAEVTIACTTHVLEQDVDPNAPSVSIGVHFANTPVFLLDAERQPVPSGQIGELYFGGPQVALGYLGRPELTAERFVTLPSGERTYRTGDLARELPNGDLDFVGRVDHQIKIRGNRVEPGEVQAALEEFDGIARAAVVAQRRGESNVLVGYVVAAEPSDDGSVPFDDAAVRTYLATRLPAYMIPSAIHAVADLPLNSNGKLDTSALPGLETGAVAIQPVTTPPPASTNAGDAALDEITAIWSKLLYVDGSTLDVNADFFALGGDSLASVEMLAQVSRSVVGTAGEPQFVAQLEGLIHQMTLGRVHAAATSARDGSSS